MAEREKSALYPSVTWSDCMDFIQKINSFNLKAVSYQELAKKYGLSSPTAKSFTGKLGAAKQFGLITTAQGNTIQLTDASKRLLFPTGEPTRPLELQCFAQPPLYAKLIGKYDGMAVPTPELLANILMNEHRITRSVKDTAAKAFLQSAEQLDLLHGGILCYSDALEAEQPKAPQQSDSELQAPAITDIATEKPAASAPVVVPAVSDADYITQSIPCENGKVAKIAIPIDATEDDLYLIHDMLNVVLHRKFKLQID